MAMVSCRDCGGQVSTAAAFCPHCGAPVASNQGGAPGGGGPGFSLGTGCLAILGLGVLFILLAGGNQEAPITEQDWARAVMANARREVTQRFRDASSVRFGPVTVHRFSGTTIKDGLVVCGSVRGDGAFDQMFISAGNREGTFLGSHMDDPMAIVDLWGKSCRGQGVLTSREP